MSRIPIRLRLTATFALAMAVVLAGAGFLFYGHLVTSLDRTLAQGLHARTADVTALVRQADTGLRESRLYVANSTAFAQVLDRRGRIFDQTPGLPRSALLTPAQLAQARHAPLLVSRSRLPGETARLLATPVVAQGKQLVVVVGAPLDTRDGTLATVRTELVVGGPLALLLASVLGYLIARSALRPVERMRTRAAAISASRLSERLPVGAARDEVSRLGETLNEMLGRLETALERERSFVADASHELRTPLAHVQAEIELALETPRKRDELEAALRSVGSEADRLSRLAEDLLLLARVDKGTLPIRLDDVALDDLLEGVAARFQRRARESGRTLTTSGNGGSARLDRLRIEQALGNLIENSLRHGAGAIRVSAVRSDDSVELHVSDEGPGFPSAFAEHAFQRFARAEESRTSAGAGLGLAIVAAVATAHGGSAGIVRASGGGADVFVRIPSLLEESVSDLRAHAPRRRTRLSADPHPPPSSQVT
jgi:heavy metal sensor kinase